MRVAVVCGPLTHTGGMGLAMQRIGAALAERGHEVTIVAPSSQSVSFRDITIDVVPDAASMPGAVRGCDVVFTSALDAALLGALAEQAPTILSAQDHAGYCPAGSKYWIQLGRPCGVRAGWKCLLARPLLNCNGRHGLLSAEPVRRVHAIERAVETGRISLLAPSASSARLLEHEGVDPRSIAVVPNLCERPDADSLVAAAEAVPPGDRDAVCFFGRLSHAKGAHLLPAVESGLGGGVRLLAHAEGYLGADLARALSPHVLRPHVGQTEVLARMLWARAVIFPSMWPEPGGLVGIDAQLAGAPLGAFAVGSPAEWPAAQLFAPGSTAALGRWAAERPACTAHRPVESVVVAADAFWREVGRGLESVASMARERRPVGPPDPDAQRAALECALAARAGDR